MNPNPDPYVSCVILVIYLTLCLSFLIGNMEMVIPASLDEILNDQHINQAEPIFILLLSAEGIASVISSMSSLSSLSLLLASSLIAWFGLKAR